MIASAAAAAAEEEEDYQPSENSSPAAVTHTVSEESLFSSNWGSIITVLANFSENAEHITESYAAALARADTLAAFTRSIRGTSTSEVTTVEGSPISTRSDSIFDYVDLHGKSDSPISNMLAAASSNDAAAGSAEALARNALANSPLEPEEEQSPQEQDALDATATQPRELPFTARVVMADEATEGGATSLLPQSEEAGAPLLQMQSQEIEKEEKDGEALHLEDEEHAHLPLLASSAEEERSSCSPEMDLCTTQPQPLPINQRNPRVRPLRMCLTRDTCCRPPLELLFTQRRQRGV
jgi:hypothetical protein